jgi:hypothetical protein
MKLKSRATTVVANLARNNYYFSHGNYWIFYSLASQYYSHARGNDESFFEQGEKKRSRAWLCGQSESVFGFDFNQ